MAKDKERGGNRGNDAGMGATDGVQSEASTKEPEELLSYEGGRNGDYHVETGHTKKTRYTGKHNDA